MFTLLDLQEPFFLVEELGEVLALVDVVMAVSIQDAETQSAIMRPKESLCARRWEDVPPEAREKLLLEKY
jgi:hypothetical protein